MSNIQNDLIDPARILSRCCYSRQRLATRHNSHLQLLLVFMRARQRTLQEISGPRCGPSSSHNAKLPLLTFPAPKRQVMPELPIHFEAMNLSKPLQKPTSHTSLFCPSRRPQPQSAHQPSYPPNPFSASPSYPSQANYTSTPPSISPQHPAPSLPSARSQARSHTAASSPPSP